MVIDYSQTINRFTELDAYPLPRIDETVNNVSRYKVFSTSDLKSAYHQVPIREDEKLYTAFEASGKLYEFNRIPFGVKNEVAAFQRVVDQILAKEKVEGAFAYVDNVTVCGETEEEHDKNLNHFLKVARDYNLTFNHDKCDFRTQSINLLGYSIKDREIRPDLERLRPLLSLPLPKDTASLRRMLGLLAHYSRWIPNFSEMLITDQRSLTFMFDTRSSSKIKNDKIARWRIELSCYHYDIVYRPGTENIPADALLHVCGAVATDKLKQLHESLCHPGVSRMVHFIRVRNLAYSVEDVKKVTASCPICSTVKPQGASFMSEELKKFLLEKGVATSRTTPYSPRGNGQVERYNGIIRKTIRLALRTRNLDVSKWEVVLPDALHSIRSLLCMSTNCTPHERFLKHPRKSTSGRTLPTWLITKGPALLRRQVQHSKNDPLVDEAEIVEANPEYAHVKFPDGRESTVSLRHLTPLSGDDSSSVEATRPSLPQSLESLGISESEVRRPDARASSEPALQEVSYDVTSGESYVQELPAASGQGTTPVPLRRSERTRWAPK
ncbi:uncharacterized protein [Palaemon carinicauda]|uniref:uncharacterized protein n=1 Tax=Palaemon carinicauda TaxID=392227 RepID=UPI0035B5917A